MISRVSSTLSVVWVTAAMRSGFSTLTVRASATRSDQHHLAGGDAEGAFHFFVAGMADENHGAALVVVFFDFEMDLGDERAGGVDDAQRAILGAVPFAGRDAVRAEDDALAGGHLVEALDKNRAFAFERLEHEAVVNDLMAHVKRPAV